MTAPQLWEITLPSIHTDQGEALSDFFEFEAVSCSWHENKDNPELWDFQAYFDEKPDLKDLKARVGQVFDPSMAATLWLTEVPQKDWLAANYRNFPPLEIANFYVYGSHIKNPSPGDRIPILVNASTAFGSGEHETTEACLKAIHHLSQGRTFHHLLDMGCGSGILAMAMAKTFNRPVIAADNDPEAVKMTAVNAEINGLDNSITPLLSEGFQDPALQGPYDLITANILAGPLCTLAKDLADHLEPEGYVILSGLLTTQKEMVEAAYRMAHCTLANSTTIGDWTTLIMRKTLDE